jgi:hypothetical protein
MSITSRLNTTQRMLGQNYVTLESAVSGFESFRTQVQSLNMKKLTAKEKTQLTSKIKKQQEDLKKAFASQLGSIESKLSQAEREHAIKTKPSSSDFNYLPLLAGKSSSDLVKMGRASTTAAKLLAAEGAMFGLSPELTASMSREASKETYAEIEQLDEEEVRLGQLQESAMKEVNQWAMKYEVDSSTAEQAAFLGDSGDGAGDL